MVPDRRHGVVQEAKPVDDACTFVGVALHERPLGGRQACRLQENCVRQGQLPDVVEKRRVAEEIELGLREPELPSDREGELLDAARMAGGVRVAGVDGRGETLHGCSRALRRRRFACSSEAFWVLIVSAASRSFKVLLWVWVRYAAIVFRIRSSGRTKTARLYSPIAS